MQIAVEWLWLTNICRVIKLKLVCTQISWISTISMHVLINETHSYFPSLIENLWVILSDKWEKVHSTLKYISLTWRFYIWKGKKQTEGREKPFEGEHRGRRRSGNSWFQLRILTGVFISVGASFFLSHYMNPCYNETSIKKKTVKGEEGKIEGWWSAGECCSLFLNR